MSDQSIFDPATAKPTGLMIETPKHANRLRHVKQSTEDLPVRFPLQMQKEYQSALFQAAVLGDIQILEALTHKESETCGLVDEQTCDNALWVSAAEHHHLFALTLLNLPAMRRKISPDGAKAAMKIALEASQEQSNHQKALVKALLGFINESKAETEAEGSEEKTRKCKKHQPTRTYSHSIQFELFEPKCFESPDSPQA